MMEWMSSKFTGVVADVWWYFGSKVGHTETVVFAYATLPKS
jgi:hypothetical protein